MPTNNTTIRLTNIPNLRKHYWRVWAYNAEGQGVYSHTGNFPTFEPPPGCVNYPQEGGGSYDEIRTYVNDLASDMSAPLAAQIDFANLAELLYWLLTAETGGYTNWYNPDCNPGGVHIICKGIFQFEPGTWSGTPEVDPQYPTDHSKSKAHTAFDSYLANSGGIVSPWWVGRGYVIGGPSDDGDDNNIWNPYAQVRAAIDMIAHQNRACEWGPYSIRYCR